MPADVDEDGSPGTLVVDGSASCVSGAYVKVSEEFIAWDIFRKFEGKVGRLAWRHFSGMWYADFPGEDEYGFLCGPLLFQLTVSSAEEADAAALRTAELDRQRLESASLKAAQTMQFAKEQAKRQSENSDRVRKLFSSLAMLQNGLWEATKDTEEARVAHDALAARSREQQALIESQATALADAHRRKEALGQELAAASGARDAAEARSAEQAVELVALGREAAESASLAAARGEAVAELERAHAADRQQLARLSEEAEAQGAELRARAAEAARLAAALEEEGAARRAAEAALAAAVARADEEVVVHAAALAALERALGEAAGARDEGAARLRAALAEMADKDTELAAAREAVARDQRRRELEACGELMLPMCDAERAALQAKWEERERALLEEAAELRAAAAEGRAAAAALEKARGEAERLQDAAKGRAADLQRAERAAQRNQLAATEGALEEARGEGARLAADLAAERAARAALEGEHSSLGEAHAAGRAELRETGARLAEAHGALAAEQSGHAATRAALAEALGAAAGNAEARAAAETAAEAAREAAEAAAEAQAGAEARLAELREAHDLHVGQAAARVAALEADCRALPAVRKELAKCRAAAAAAAAAAAEALDAEREAGERLRAALTAAQRGVRLETTLARELRRQLDRQLTFDAPVVAAFAPWRLVTLAERTRAVEAKRAEALAELRRARHEADSLRRRLGAAHRLVEEMQRRDKAAHAAATILELELKAPPATPPPAPPSPHADAPPALSPAPTGGNGSKGSAPLSPGPMRRRPATAHGTRPSLPVGPAAPLGVMEMFPALAGTLVDSAAQTDPAEAGGAGVVVAGLGAGASSGAGAGATDAGVLEKSASLAAELARDSEGYRQRCLRLQREARAAEAEARTRGEQLTAAEAALAELQRERASLRGAAGALDALVPALRSRREAADLRAALQKTLYRVAEAEGALPAAGGARGAAAAGESVIATRARELQQQHQQEHQEQEPERGADAPTPSLTPEAVEDDLAGALGVLSGHLAHLTARFGKGRGGARRPAPLDALKPVPRAGGPAGRVASPLLGASLRAGGARARPQSAMGRL